MSPPRSLLLAVSVTLPLTVVACGGKGKSSTRGAVPPGSPTLVGTSPSDGERVGPTDALIATFDVALLTTSVAPAVAAIESAQAALAKAGATALVGTNVVAFAPGAPWALDAVVTLTIDTTLRSAADVPLAGAQTIARATAPTTERPGGPGGGSSPGSSQSVVALRDGRLLVSGGNLGGTIGAVVTTTLVDPTTGAATAGGDLAAPRFSHVPVLLDDGKVAAVGGQTSSAIHTTIEVFDPASNAWSVRASGLAPRTTLQGVFRLADGRWLVVGGYANTAQSVPQTTIQVLSADMSVVTTSALTSTLGGQVVMIPGAVVLFGNEGGATPGPTDDLEVLEVDASLTDPVTRVTRLADVLVAPAGSTPGGWAHPSACVIPGDGRILVQVADATSIVDVTLNGATPPTALGVAGPALIGRGRTFTRMLPTPDGSVLIGPGGRSPGGSGTDPVADLFRPAGAGSLVPLTPRTGRRSSSLGVLADGRIALVGGRQGGLTGPLLTGADTLEVLTHEALAQGSIRTSRQTIGIGVAPVDSGTIAATGRTFTFFTSGALDPATVSLAAALSVTVDAQPVAYTATLTSARRLTVTLAPSVTLAPGDVVEVRLGAALRDLEGRTLDLTRGVTRGAWTVRP